MPNDAKFRSILSALDDIGCGLVIYGQDFRILHANETIGHAFPAFTATLHQDRTIREAVAAQLGNRDRAEGDTGIEALSDDYVTRILAGERVELKASDGRMMRALHAPLPDGGHVGLFVDISDLREEQAALREAHREARAANDAKTRFLAMISHEIRTPLNGVLGMAQVLARRPLAGEEREMVETLVESSNTLLTILNEILDLSKIEAGEVAIHPVPADLRHTLRHIERLHRGSASAKGLDFRIAVATSVPTWLRFDPDRVRQCITNLVSNAIKFTHGGAVHVAAAAEAAGPEAVDVVIHVHDTGIGISPEALPRLFGSFVQADPSIARTYGGTGLGLSITRHVLQKMGGDVQVVSQPGQGSVFTMRFRADIVQDMPVQTSAGVASAMGRLPLDSLCGVRALLVDDNAINRQVARRLLEPFGVDVHEVASGPSALSALRHEAFDVVLLDMHMPGVDGLDTFQEIRASGQSWSDIPVIALTADALPGDRERVLAMGMDGYAAKPIRERELVAAILAPLSKRGAPASPQAASTGT